MTQKPKQVRWDIYPVKKTTRQLESIDRRARISQDKMDRLRALKEHFEHIAYLVEETIDSARAEDRSWEEIGDALGISRQAAWNRFKGPGR